MSGVEGGVGGVTERVRDKHRQDAPSPKMTWHAELVLKLELISETEKKVFWLSMRNSGSLVVTKFQTP